MSKRPERDQVEKALSENPKRKAHEIAEEAGLIDTIGYDKAVSYVKQVKRSMKAKGQIQIGPRATDAERMQDMDTLFTIRAGKKLSKSTATMMLLLNCYYRLKSEDDRTHMMAIDDTYAKNAELESPLTMAEAINICEVALNRYMRSIDETKNAAARKRGYPGAGIHYSDDRLIEKLKISDKERERLISLKG